MYSFRKVLLFSTLVLLIIAAQNGPGFSKPAKPYELLNPKDSNDAVISGFVKDSASGETLIGATVKVKSLKRGAITNKSGYFVLHLPSEENLLLEVSSIGYKTYQETINLKAEEKRSVTIALTSSSILGQEVTVETDKERERQEPQVSRINIQPAQIASLPKAGEADLFRTLQTLPGVQTASEISSGLYIRGGSPDQNLILLDGSVLYNPNHLFGFFSTFNSDAIKDVELIKGGFPVEYGGRLSAVLSVTNKDGDLNQTKGKFSLGLVSSRATIETPIGSGALSLSGRRTYIDLILKASGLQEELNIPNYHFYDFNGKITQNPSQNDKLSLSGYGGEDKLDFENEKAGSTVGFNWGNKSGSLQWTHIFDADLFSKFNVNASNFFSRLDAGSGGEGFSWDNKIYDYTFNGSLEYFYEQEHQFKLGVQATAYNFKFKVQAGNNPPGGDLDLSPIYGALYLQDEWKASEQVAVTGGLRVDGISSRTQDIGLDPRISARYILTPDITLKGSVGIYHQYLKLATNPLFSFFDVWLPVDSTQAPSVANQYVLGVSTVPFEGYTLDVEAYYKNMTNLVELRPNIISGKTLRDIHFVGDGTAYGIEFFLQKQIGDFTGWLGYSLAWTNRTFPELNNGEEFPATYDRRNDLNIVLTYKLSDAWTIGSTFVYATGQAYTQTTALYPATHPEDEGIILAIPGKRNGLRLEPYNRLDVSATYAFRFFSERRNATFNLDIYNIYNHRNVWFKQVDASKNPAEVSDVRLLPILPTFGLQIEF